MTEFRIKYPWGDEPMTGWEMHAGVYQPTSFSLFMPLAPKDQVKVDNGFVTGVHRLAELFIVEAHFKLGTAESYVHERVAEWQQATDAVVSTALTARVSAGSQQWLTDVVESDPRMEFVQLERVPSQDFNFEAQIEDA